MRFVLFAFFLILSLQVPAAEIITSAVGQVSDHVVTSREVLMSNIYERWRIASQSVDAAGKQPRPDWRPSLSSDVFRQATSSLLLEHTVAKEAESFSVAQVERDAIRKNTKDFLAAVAGFSEWKKLEASEGETEKMIERKMRAQSFLKFKTESAGVIVTEEDAKAYYEKNRMKFGNMPFSQFKDSIKEVLTKQILEDRLKEWFEVLRRKYRVRNLGQLES